MQRTSLSLGAASCLALLFAGSFAGAASLASEDQETLHAAGLGSDGSALLAFFQARARSRVDGETLDRLLEQFAAAAREEQESAGEKLLGLGPLALPALRQAANNLDHPDLAVRAALYLPWLDGPASLKLVTAAARALAVLKPEGAAAALLGYLPFADNEEIIQEIQAALAAVSAPGGKADKAVLGGLGDSAGLRRAAAGVALCRAAPPQSVPAVRNLLKDPAPAVRLRAALALAEAGEGEAVPVLIDLLAELPAEQCGPVEEVLRQLAGEWAPVLEFARDDAVSRLVRRDVWASWWRHTDCPLLLRTLGKHTLTAAKREQVRRLIDRLGSEDFNVRENAGEDLAALGRIALPQLRKATRDRDREVGRRAALLIERIEREPTQLLPLAVLRLLAVRKTPGAVEALLAFLPSAEEDGQTEEARQALGRLALRDGKLDPALRQALSDAQPLVRIAAAAALAAGGGTEGRTAAHKLLGDAAPPVRLHVALALARTGEREAVGVLIDLLAVLPAEQVGMVEDALYALAGDGAPEVSGGDKPEERTKCRDAWAAWWKANGDRIDLAGLSHPPALGRTLVCDTGSHRLFEVDRRGKELWAIEKAGEPTDAAVLPGGRVLVAEWQNNRITERDFQGKILWEKSVPGAPCNVQRLANGNTFIALQGGAILEVDRAGKEVLTIPAVPGGLLAARRSPRGDIVCTTGNGQCLLLDATGKQVGGFASGHGAESRGGLDLLANGHVLVTWREAGKVMEFDRDGKKLFEWTAAGARTATALPNGHILVACHGTNRVWEMDRAGRVVWEHKTAGNPHRAWRR